jgi:hypothetical protein
MTDQFSQYSIDITNGLTKQEKKDNGIFLTPRIIRQKLNERTMYWMNELKIKPKLILEPSCGSCEFISDLDGIYKKINFIGVEKNKKIFDIISQQQITKNNKLTLLNDDFLETSLVNVDLVIGNPPYFVLNTKNIPTEYKQYMNGRPNIYCLFILHALKTLHTKKNSLLSFVIPKSILNSSYYEGVRKYIYDNYNLLELIDFRSDNNFMDTDQDTVGIIITNNRQIKSPIEYIIQTENSGIIMTLNRVLLAELYENSTTLKMLGLGVKTGSIVWNEHKDILTDDTKHTLLLYNSNISKNQLELKQFKNDTKKQYIIQDKSEKKPFIVVNRGRGNANFDLSFYKIDEDNVKQNVLIENHLNIIFNKTNSDPWILDKIIVSLQDKRTIRFLELFSGNNALSKTELETILPIYV